MANTLNGKNVLILSTNYGTETSELIEPLNYFKDHGAQVTVAAQTSEPIATLAGDKKLSTEVDPDTTISAVDASGYDAVVVPGGTLNADSLRIDSDAQGIVQSFAKDGKIVAMICHAPWLLVNSGLAKGKTLTSYHTLSQDITNAGGNWVDQEVKVCPANGYRLITSRSPADLDAFNSAIEETLTSKA
ncbi:MAG: type 1 glutamine amidotransferase domain-containing protein [Ancrocorticia sp.]|uniref:type 1 glutamine amidotransferase domain-containing protein n=1 Tax=Ancrocorticia sp. TaxID=2593684 RepID=UPI003F8DCFC5